MSKEEHESNDASNDEEQPLAPPKRKESLHSKVSELTKDHEAEEEFLLADSYEYSIIGQILKWFIFLCTGGLAGLVYVWYLPANFVFHRRCRPDKASKFLILTIHKTWVSVNVKVHHGIKYFNFNGLRYIYNGHKYVVATFVDKAWSHQDIVDMSCGLSQREITTPANEVNESENIINVPVEHPLIMGGRELLDPNNIYIYLCCLLWFGHAYETFAALILATSVLSSIFTVWTTRASRMEIRRMAKYITKIDVLRDNSWSTIDSSKLYPGDVVAVPQGVTFKAPCDMVVISGSAIVDETSLTGESLPVVKLKLKGDAKKMYNAEKDKGSTIYSGTNVIGAVPSTGKNSSKKVLAVVTRTGWKTAKGHLIRSILSVKPHVYQYEREAIIFLIILIGVGIMLFFISLWLWGSYEDGGWDNENILYGFEAIAILVPPMLPALFHVCILAAAATLKRDYNIYTTDPSRIPLSGKIDVMCFDKTGTLTKDDLDLIGVVPVKKSKDFEDISTFKSIKDSYTKLVHSMVTCHTLSKIDSSLVGQNGNVKYSGPQVDMKIFEATEWDYEDPNEDSPAHVTDGKKIKLDILKRFDFDPALQRMSAIVRDPKSRTVYVVCKGSPEIIKTVCDAGTLPKSYSTESKKHSQNGCYVLAIAMREAPEIDLKKIDNIKRTDIEGNLELLGLILLRNELKPDTTEAIRNLKRGRIRSVIITGDNIFTAFYIAKKCRLVGASRECFIGDVEDTGKGAKVTFRSAFNPDRELEVTTDDISKGYVITDRKTEKSENVKEKEVSIGVTTHAWDELMKSSENAEFLINRVKIFARMKPLQKEAVVKLISSADHVVGMCGDGANDCAALSAADCGIALSEAEASVVSPFTARDLKIGSVVHLIREARGALANAFATFKYTVVYGMTQTTQAMIAYVYGADLSEAMYLFIDFGFFLPMAYFTVMGQSSDHLQDDPPTARVFGPRTLSSVIGHAGLMIVFMLAGLGLLRAQSWYTPSELADDTLYYTPETSTIWQVGTFSYASTAVAFAFGSHWRKPFYFNILLMTLVTWTLICITSFTFLLPETDPTGAIDLLSFVQFPIEYRVKIHVLGWGLFFTQLVYEKVFIGDFIGDKLRDCAGRGRKLEDDDDDVPDDVNVDNEVPLQEKTDRKSGGTDDDNDSDNEKSNTKKQKEDSDDESDKVTKEVSENNSSEDDKEATESKSNAKSKSDDKSKASSEDVGTEEDDKKETDEDEDKEDDEEDEDSE